MKTVSKKQKGSRFERWIAKQIELAGLGTAHREYMSGAGFRKGDIASSIPFLIEAKHQKKLSTLTWIDQSKREAVQGNYDRDKWALVFNDPRVKPEFTQVYAVIDFGEFLELLKKAQEPLTKEPDRDMKYSLMRLKGAINSVMKKL